METGWPGEFWIDFCSRTTLYADLDAEGLLDVRMELQRERQELVKLLDEYHLEDKYQVEKVRRNISRLRCGDQNCDCLNLVCRCNSRKQLRHEQRNHELGNAGIVDVLDSLDIVDTRMAIVRARVYQVVS